MAKTLHDQSCITTTLVRQGEKYGDYRQKPGFDVKGFEESPNEGMIVKLMPLGPEDLGDVSDVQRFEEMRWLTVKIQS